MKTGRWSRIAMILVLLVAMIVTTIVLADTTVADGDGVEPVVSQAMDFGTVCAGSTTTQTALVRVNRNGAAGSTNVFKDGSTVTVSVNSVSGLGLSAKMGSPATITLPANWGSLQNNSDSDSVSSDVTFVAGAAGTFTGSVIYRGTGVNTSNATITRDDQMNVTATVVVCNTAPTVTVSGGPFTYDGLAHFATVTVTGTGDVVVDGSSIITYKDALNNVVTAPTNAGTYSVAVAFTSSDSNYTNATGSGSITINPAPVTATAGSGSGTYNGALQSPAACAVSGAYTVGLTCANNPVSVGPDAGTYAIAPDVSGTGLSNFAVTSVAGSYTINKAPVTITAGSYSGTYDGLSHSPSDCVVSGTAKGNLTCTNDLASVGPNVGSGAVVPALVLNGETASNFAVTTANGSWSITPAPVTITAGSYSGTYDGTSHDTSACIVTGAYKGTLTCTNNPASVKDAGLGDVTPELVLNAETGSNFTVTKKTGLWSIATAPVTITAGSYSGTYDGTSHATSACSVEGLYKGTITCTNDLASVGPNVGDGVVAPVLALNSEIATNFVVTSVNGSWAIMKANATCGITGYNVVFDNAAHTATGSCTGVLNENLSGLNLSGTVHTAVGNYTDPWTFTDGTGNYNNTTGSVNDVILSWTLKGFYQPVDMNGVLNTVKNGSTVPLKFEVFAGSTELTTTDAISAVFTKQVTCNATIEDTIEVVSTGGTSLRYDLTGGQFIYNWQTPKLAGKCYTVTVTTLDGSLISAYFKLK